MRILFYGAGVIGSLMAVQFAKAKLDVTIYARGKRFNQLKTQGLLYEEENVIRKQTVKIIEHLENDDVFDYIFLCVRNEQLYPCLEALKHQKSPTIVTMVNSITPYAIWEKICGKKRIIPAFPGGGGSIDDEGVLRARLTPPLIQKTTFGEIDGSNTLRLRTLRLLFQMAHIPYKMVDDMYLWQLCHVALVVPLANVYYQPFHFQTVQAMIIQVKSNFRFILKKHERLLPMQLQMVYHLPTCILTMIMYYVYQTKFANRFMYQHALKAKQEMQVLEATLNTYLKGITE